jgi:phosphopentomutase
VGGLRLPHLEALGLGNIGSIPGVEPAGRPRASFGKMSEVSQGKDSTTGHWELAGLPLTQEFPTYPQGFSQELLRKFLDVTGCGGYLGNTTASGTVIIQELGDEHVRTGYPIVYTSADSVFQIAVHEEVIPIPRLYAICQKTRDKVCVGEHAVGRVIARPFAGKSGAYVRTTNRKDFSLKPFGTTVLDLLSSEGIPTLGVGKVDDLYAGCGLRVTNHTRSNRDGIEAIIAFARETDRGLIIANLGDFDSLYGHRNDPGGFAGALQEFDARLPDILETVGPEDLLLITADHGNDPVTPSTDHSREYVPILCYSGLRGVGCDLGIRSAFADVGKTIADYFGIHNSLAGRSFLGEVRAV